MFKFLINFFVNIKNIDYSYCFKNIGMIEDEEFIEIWKSKVNEGYILYK